MARQRPVDHGPLEEGDLERLRWSTDKIVSTSAFGGLTAVLCLIVPDPNDHPYFALFFLGNQSDWPDERPSVSTSTVYAASYQQKEVSQQSQTSARI